MSHMTVSFIEEIARNLKARGKFSTPLLIHCLQDDPPPILENTARSGEPELDRSYESNREPNGVSDLDFNCQLDDSPPLDNPIWEKLINTISGNQQLSSVFKKQLDHCTNIDFDGEEVSIEVNDHYSFLWLTSNAKSVISNAFIGILGRHVNIVFRGTSRRQ